MFWIPNITTMLLAWIMQSVILSGFIWFDKMRKPSESYTCWLVRGLRGGVFIIFGVFSLVFIDTNLKILVFGIIGYGNIMLHMTSIILTFVLAIEFLFVSTFVAPNRKGLSTFGIIVSYFIFFWYIFLPSANYSELNLFSSKYSVFLAGVLFPILIGIVSAFILTFIELIVRKYQNETFKDTPFYNIQVSAKKKLNLKFNLLLWGLITTELLLNLQGMSLLIWFSF